uniref:50S ribosomal protein L11 methyltransferase n=1 Tax=Alloprevotella sp. TaxID=1872471 RepID=UPI003FEF4EC9
MQYLEFTFTTRPATEAVQDVLSAVLAEIGFDSFVHTDELDRPAVAHCANPEQPTFEAKLDEDHFQCYIQKALFDQQALDDSLAAFPLSDVEITYQMAEAEDKDWNEEWEKNYFKPLVVDDRCVIASTFHTDVPEAEYKITINPQMSFGTGHHATTSQMISRLLTDDITGLEVLDMGCGTSILAILARMRGAKHCVGIDVDEWCVKNSRENIALNHLDGIDVELGDASSLADKGPFDLVIANINLGILLNDLKYYVPRMKEGAHIYMSGFYDTDIPQLMAEAEKQGLTLVDEHVLDGWACLKLKK